MPTSPPSRADAEAAMRRLLSEHDLPEPDEVQPHEDGGIVCLWHEPKVAVVIDLDEGPSLATDASLVTDD